MGRDKEVARRKGKQQGINREEMVNSKAKSIIEEKQIKARR
jgi:hypothetical protein